MKRKLLLIFARLKKNYTTDYMAKELGITRKQYSSIENGHTVNVKDYHKDIIANLLEIDKSFLDIDEGNIIISGNKENGFQIADHKNAQFQTVWNLKEGTNQKELVISVQILEIVSIHPEP